MCGSRGIGVRFYGVEGSRGCCMGLRGAAVLIRNDEL